jgi:hypothetical protein
MARGVRPFGLALAASLLLHMVLLGGLQGELPRWERPVEAPPFEAQLVSVPKPAVAVAAPTPPAPSARARSVRPAVKRAAAPPVEAPAEAAVPETAAPELTTPEAVDDAGLIERAEPPAAATLPIESAPAAPAPPPLNPLPPRLDLRYRVRYGLAGGEQTLVWINEGEHYTLTSVASATGLTSMFYRGQFVQTSRGRITPRGLQPEEFWDQRGDKRSSARFDAAQGQLTLQPDRGEPRHFTYQGDAQDALSLFFQLALTAPPPDGQFSYTVFNGKKLREYRYEVRGEATLETALGALRTLHLARVVNGDGRFEVWLAIDRHYLPVQVLRSDEEGNEMELSVQAITP